MRRSFVLNHSPLQASRHMGGVVLLAAALAFGVTPSKAQTPAPAVPTYVVQAVSVGAAYVLDGVIEPVRQSTIAAQASGRIASLLVKAGDSVRSGQVLATIDDREASAGLQRSQAQVNQADAELRNAQANLVRTRDLQSKGFVSKAALDSASTQREAAQAQREQAVAGARQSGLSQSFTRVTAPFDGRVLQTLAEAGDLAVPGKPLLTLFAPAPLRATVQVPASRAQAARGASQIVVQVDDGSGGLRAITPVGRVATPSSDPISQTTEWRLELAPADTANLVPGQQVRVRFTLPQTDAATQLLVPQAAIVRRGELTAVYVVVNGAFSLRAVRLGADRGAEGVEVLAGIKSGDAVALAPNRAGFANATPAAPSAQTAPTAK